MIDSVHRWLRNYVDCPGNRVLTFSRGMVNSNWGKKCFVSLFL